MSNVNHQMKLSFFGLFLLNWIQSRYVSLLQGHGMALLGAGQWCGLVHRWAGPERRQAAQLRLSPSWSFNTGEPYMGLDLKGRPANHVYRHNRPNFEKPPL